ncbi:unnamed protein product [Acanthoscelides obtectus]|uniref:Uncharacterized protein n=1 Tax=Acanthoscelides obtectus TaxID=200917 RepID=A0A9P0LCM0_ACAOB|nr:unnamed protein product [Acanthoscelides obtectus]CAK1670124.1 hypothetical protein AOBTE_LOCUS27417 [Acanthoscelides obtectus]
MCEANFRVMKNVIQAPRKRIHGVQVAVNSLRNRGRELRSLFA